MQPTVHLLFVELGSEKSDFFMVPTDNLLPCKDGPTMKSNNLSLVSKPSGVQNLNKAFFIWNIHKTSCLFQEPIMKTGEKHLNMQFSILRKHANGTLNFMILAFLSCLSKCSRRNRNCRHIWTFEKELRHNYRSWFLPRFSQSTVFCIGLFNRDNSGFLLYSGTKTDHKCRNFFFLLHKSRCSISQPFNNPPSSIASTDLYRTNSSRYWQHYFRVLKWNQQIAKWATSRDLSRW